MQQIDDIVGSGGGKGNSPVSGSQEDPNNLISRAVARVIDLLGEGEIGGLVDGGRSVYLDGTPLENPDGNTDICWSVITDQQRIAVWKQY